MVLAPKMENGSRDSAGSHSSSGEYCKQGATRIGVPDGLPGNWGLSGPGRGRTSGGTTDKASIFLMKEKLIALFKAHFSEDVAAVSEVKAHASRRQMFRLRGKGNLAVSVANSDIKENTAFIEFTRHFRYRGLPVPEIYGINLREGLYLMEDLGDTTFFDVLDKSREHGEAPNSKCRSLLFQILTMLPRFQVDGAEGQHLFFCHPSREFDKAGVLRDMYFFEREFLKRTNVKYSSEVLYRNFEDIAAFIHGSGCRYFMYRDFQSRNVMIRDDRPFFLDYQGGCKGPLQYDVVSFLYQSKANLPQDLRDEATEEYLDVISSMKPFPREDFFFISTLSYLYVFCRCLPPTASRVLGSESPAFWRASRTRLEI